MTLIFLLSSLRTNYFYSPLPTTPSCWCFIYKVTDEDKNFEEVLTSLPKNEIITASNEIRPHINHRPYAYSVPSATESAKFIALINQNRIVGNFEIKEYETELIKILSSSPQYKVKYKSEHFYLFERIY